MKTNRKEIARNTPTRDLTPFDEMDRLFDTMTNRRWVRPFVLRCLREVAASTSLMHRRATNVDAVVRFAKQVGRYSTKLISLAKSVLLD